MFSKQCCEISRIKISMLQMEALGSEYLRNWHDYLHRNPGILTQGGLLASSHLLGFPGGSAEKNPPANAGDAGLIPGSGRSPGEGNRNPFQYSCLGNLTARGTWWARVAGVTKSQTQQLKNKNQHATCEFYTWLVGGLVSLNKQKLDFANPIFRIAFSNIRFHFQLHSMRIGFLD